MENEGQSQSFDVSVSGYSFDQNERSVADTGRSTAASVSARLGAIFARMSVSVAAAERMKKAENMDGDLLDEIHARDSRIVRGMSMAMKMDDTDALKDLTRRSKEYGIVSSGDMNMVEDAEVHILEKLQARIDAAEAEFDHMDFLSQKSLVKLLNDPEIPSSSTRKLRSFAERRKMTMDEVDRGFRRHLHDKNVKELEELWREAVSADLTADDLPELLETETLIIKEKLKIINEIELDNSSSVLSLHKAWQKVDLTPHSQRALRSVLTEMADSSNRIEVLKSCEEGIKKQRGFDLRCQMRKAVLSEDPYSILDVLPDVCLNPDVMPHDDLEDFYSEIININCDNWKRSQTLIAREWPIARINVNNNHKLFADPSLNVNRNKGKRRRYPGAGMVYEEAEDDIWFPHEKRKGRNSCALGGNVNRKAGGQKSCAGRALPYNAVGLIYDIGDYDEDEDDDEWEDTRMAPRERAPAQTQQRSVVTAAAAPPVQTSIVEESAKPSSMKSVQEEEEPREQSRKSSVRVQDQEPESGDESPCEEESGSELEETAAPSKKSAASAAGSVAASASVAAPPGPAASKKSALAASVKPPAHVDRGRPGASRPGGSSRPTYKSVRSKARSTYTTPGMMFDSGSSSSFEFSDYERGPKAARPPTKPPIDRGEGPAFDKASRAPTVASKITKKSTFSTAPGMVFDDFGSGSLSRTSSELRRMQMEELRRAGVRDSDPRMQALLKGAKASKADDLKRQMEELRRQGVRDSDPRMQALKKSLAEAGDKDEIKRQMEELRRQGVRDSDPRMQALKKSLAEAGDKDEIQRQMDELRRQGVRDSDPRMQALKKSLAEAGDKDELKRQMEELRRQGVRDSDPRMQALKKSLAEAGDKDEIQKQMEELRRQGVRDSDPRMQALKKSLAEADQKDDIKREMEELRKQGVRDSDPRMQALKKSLAEAGDKDEIQRQMEELRKAGVRDSDPRMQALKKSLAEADEKDDIKRQMEELKKQGVRDSDPRMQALRKSLAEAGDKDEIQRQMEELKKAGVRDSDPRMQALRKSLAEAEQKDEIQRQMEELRKSGVRDSDPRMQALRKSLAETEGGKVSAADQAARDDVARQMEELRKMGVRDSDPRMQQLLKEDERLADKMLEEAKKSGLRDEDQAMKDLRVAVGEKDERQAKLDKELEEARARGDEAAVKRLLEESGRGDEAMTRRTSDIKRSVAGAADTAALVTKTSAQLEKELKDLGLSDAEIQRRLEENRERRSQAEADMRAAKKAGSIQMEDALAKGAAAGMDDSKAAAEVSKDLAKILKKYGDVSKDQIELIQTLYFSRTKTVKHLLDDLKKKGKSSDEILGPAEDVYQAQQERDTNLKMAVRTVNRGDDQIFEVVDSYKSVGLTNSDGELATAESGQLPTAKNKGEEKLKNIMKKTTTSAATSYWKGADKGGLKDEKYLDRIVADLPYKDAEAKKDVKEATNMDNITCLFEAIKEFRSRGLEDESLILDAEMKLILLVAYKHKKLPYNKRELEGHFRRLHKNALIGFTAPGDATADAKSALESAKAAKAAATKDIQAKIGNAASLSMDDLEKVIESFHMEGLSAGSDGDLYKAEKELLQKTIKTDPNKLRKNLRLVSFNGLKMALPELDQSYPEINEEMKEKERLKAECIKELQRGIKEKNLDVLQCNHHLSKKLGLEESTDPIGNANKMIFELLNGDAKGKGGGDMDLSRFSKMSIGSLEQLLESFKKNGLGDDHPAVKAARKALEDQRRAKEEAKKELERAIASGDVDAIKKAMDKLKTTGGLDDNETNMLLDGMKTLEKNVKEESKRSLSEGIDKAGASAGKKAVDDLEKFGLDKDGEVLKSGGEAVKGQQSKEDAARKRLEDALRKGNDREILEALKAARGVLPDDDPLMKRAEQHLVQAALKDDKLMNDLKNVIGRQAMEEAIADMEKSGADPATIAKAKANLADMESRDAKLKKELEAALESGDPKRIQAALEKAKAAGLMNDDPALIQKAEHFLLRADPKAAKENLKKSSVEAAEGYMTGKPGATKEVAALKERDEMLKKKLEQALASGRESLIRQALLECKEAGLTDKDLGGLMTKAEKQLVKGPHNKSDKVMATFELMSEDALAKKIQELKESGEDPQLLAELEKVLKEKQAKGAKLRAELEKAIESRNIDKLEKAIDNFKAAGLTQADGPLEEAELLLLQLLMESGDMARLEKRMRLAGKNAVAKALKEAEAAGPDSPAAKLAAKILKEKEKEEDDIKERLRKAIESGDKAALAKALKEAKAAGIADDGLISQAESMLIDKAKGDLKAAQRDIKEQAFKSNKGAVDKFAGGKGGKSVAGVKKQLSERDEQLVAALKEAIEIGEISVLEAAIRDYRGAGLTNKEGPLDKAEMLLIMLIKKAEENGETVRRPSFLKDRIDDPYGLKGKLKTKADLEREIRKAMAAGDMGRLEYLLDQARAQGYNSQDLGIMKQAKKQLEAGVGKARRFSAEERARMNAAREKGLAMEAEAMKIKDPKERALALLRAAVVMRDKKKIELRLEEVKKVGAKVPKEEMDQINYLLGVLDCRAKTLRAIKDKDAVQLEKQLKIAKAKGYFEDEEHAGFFLNAEHQLGLMMAMDEIIEDVWTMTGYDIAEVRTYRCPPKGVRSVILAFFRLLGYEWQYLQSWKQIQVLLTFWLKITSRYILGRVEPKDLQYEHAMDAKKLLTGWDTDAMIYKSKPVAVFFRWTYNMVYQVTNFRDVNDD